LLEVSRLQNDPEQLSRLYERYPEQMREIDDHHVLKNLLDRLPSWVAKGFPSKEKREEFFRQAVDTVLESSAHSFVLTVDSQLPAMCKDEWSGRYVGRWHVHPPDYQPETWAAAEPPSDDDMEIAQRNGQNLTIAFDPQGFDVYDLSALYGSTGLDASKIGKITYRNPQWGEHFQELHKKLVLKP
jgi:hypothetical protein